jgi:hypothetical protein
MKALLLFLLIISWACVPSSYGASSAMRCFNQPKSVKGALQRSTAVFSGEVLEIRSSLNLLQARFRVERSWKGVEAEEVWVSSDDTAESPHYRVGEKYLVFAGIRNETLFTSSCSRTKQLVYAEADLKQLGEGKPKKAQLGRGQAEK